MKDFIVYMIKNKVAANLLLIALFVIGLIAGKSIPQEVFPNIEFDRINIKLGYPGAAPSEVAKAICLPLQDAISNIVGVKDASCTSMEGAASMRLTLQEGEELNDVFEEVRTAVDGIGDFPEDATKPVVGKASHNRDIMELALVSNSSEMELYRYARHVRDEVRRIKGVAVASLMVDRGEEIEIAVEPDVMKHYHLSLSSLSQMIKSNSLDLGAGSINQRTGKILLGVKERKTGVEQIKKIPVLTTKEGSQLLLGEIAEVKWKLERSLRDTIIDGKRAVIIDIKQHNSYTPGQVSKNIRHYVERKSKVLPYGYSFKVFRDRSTYFEDRFNLLIRNGLLGLLLVLVSLSLFLEIRLAFWVMIGIPASFLGSLIFLPMAGVTINMMSLFAFILVLGIVVDDAIVIGEAIFKHREKGKDFITAAIDGTKEVAGAVTFAILTTMIAFLPLAFTKGMMGAFLFATPIIVISVIGISLLEALFILPAHLAHSSREPFNHPLLTLIEKARVGTTKLLQNFINGTFSKVLDAALRHCFLSISIGLAFLILCLGMVAGKIIRVEFFPNIEGDRLRVSGQLPAGYSREETMRIVKKIEKIGRKSLEGMERKLGVDPEDTSLKSVYSRISQARNSGKTSFRVSLDLQPERKVSIFKLKRVWRKKIGSIPGVEGLKLASRGMHFGTDISLSLSHFDHDTLLKAINYMKTELTRYQGVHEVELSEEAGNTMLVFKPSIVAESLGINAATLARAVRSGFQGIDLSSFYHQGTEVNVVLRYNQKYRDHLNLLEQIPLLGKNGKSITLGEAADISEHVEPVTLLQENGRPTIRLSASVAEEKANLDDIQQEIEEKLVPQVERKFSGLSVSFGGAREERKKSMKSFLSGYIIALIGIYTLLALFFHSYTQPLIVMLGIPFGLAGGIIGHWLLGYNLSSMSLFGFIGLSGVVVNDSLILIHAVKLYLDQGLDVHQALLEAAKSRVRPIFLTSLTTFVGLMPMLLETSRQAKFLVPMAISLAMGILFATFIILVLVPAIYRAFVYLKFTRIQARQP